MLDSVKQSAGVIAISVMLSSIGLVWLSIALVQTLSPAIGPAASAAIVGGLFIVVPAAVLVTSAALGRKTAAIKLAKQDEESSGVMTLVAKVAEGMASETPLLAVGFAMLAGVASVKFPSAIQPLLVRLMQNQTLSTPSSQSFRSNGKDPPTRNDTA